MRKDVFHLNFRTSESFDYVVKKGDTLCGIAESCGVELKDLVAANMLAEALIHPGQKIVIPRNGGTGALYFEEYMVEPSDKMAAIARKFNIQPALLMKYNDITKLNLAENQVVRIPKRRIYQIKDGDSLESILRENNLSFERFIETNLKNWLRPGNRVYVE